MSNQDRDCNSCGKPLFEEDPEELTSLCDVCRKEFEDNDEPLFLD